LEIVKHHYYLLLYVNFHSSMFVLIKVLWSLLLTTISYAMVAKLYCDYNISTFVCPLPLGVDVKLRPDLDDGTYVNSYIDSLLTGIRGLGITDGVDVLSITFCHNFENVLMVCPFIGFNCAKTSSLYNMTFSFPSSLDLTIFNFFKASQSWSFKMSSWEIFSKLVVLCSHTRLGISCVTFFLSFEYLQNVDAKLRPWCSNEVIP
jgi:hypothetical protein